MLKKALIFIMAGIFLLLGLPQSADAAVSLPYDSYSYDSDGWPMRMPAPYIPAGILGQSLAVVEEGEKRIGKGLSNPEDICIDSEGYLYVADKDNNRIVKFGRDGVIRQEFGNYGEENSDLRSPEGVYVDGDGNVYAADTGNYRIVIYDRHGRMSGFIEKPDDVRLRNVLFTPIKLTVDARGYLFVAVKGGNEGLLILSPGGKFQGFFGRNKTELGMFEKLKRLFYTSEQIATNDNDRAMTVSGVVAGKDGYVYTCTQNMKKGQIKKFNANSEDLFGNKNFQVKIPYWITKGKTFDSSIAAITVDEDGNIFAADQNNGAILIYDSQGNVLAIFGARLSGNEQRTGVFGLISGVAVGPDGYLYVLDKQYNGIHVFRPSSLMANILDAVALYNNGLYDEAVMLWQDILKIDANYLLANRGLGKAAYVNKDWKTAMAQMKIAESQTLYSEAMWQYRSAWVQKNITGVLAILLIVSVVYLAVSKILKFSPFRLCRKGVGRAAGLCAAPVFARVPVLKKRWDETVYAFQTLKHPVDTFYNATRRGKGSLWSAAAVFVLYVAAQFASIACTSFSFNKYGLDGMDPAEAILKYIAPILFWIFGVYLVGAITKGQGTFRAVAVTSMYCLIPMIVFRFPLALLSNILTLTEKPIYLAFQGILAAWTVLLLFIQVKEVQGYEFGETVRNIFWILFTIGIAAVLGLAVGGIAVQALNFSNEFVREVLGYV